MLTSDSSSFISSSTVPKPNVSLIKSRGFSLCFNYDPLLKKLLLNGVISSLSSTYLLKCSFLADLKENCYSANLLEFAVLTNYCLYPVLLLFPNCPLTLSLLEESVSIDLYWDVYYNKGISFSALKESDLPIYLKFSLSH